MISFVTLFSALVVTQAPLFLVVVSCASSSRRYDDTKKLLILDMKRYFERASSSCEMTRKIDKTLKTMEMPLLYMLCASSDRR